MENLLTNGEKYSLKWSKLRKKDYGCVINLSNKIEHNNRSPILK
jgi:hypothetical protein